MVRRTFKVPDMTCANCVMKLESLEDELEGVREIRASYHRLEMVVEYDETVLAEAGIINAVQAKGYTILPSD